MDKMPEKYKGTVIEYMLTGNNKGDGTRRFSWRNRWWRKECMSPGNDRDETLDRQALVVCCMDAAIYAGDFDVPGKLDYIRLAGNQLTEENVTELLVATDKHKVKYIVVMGHETADGACGMSHISEHEEHVAEKFAERRGIPVEGARPIISKYLSMKDIGDARENVANQLRWLRDLEINGVRIVPKDVELVGMYYTKDRKVELV